MFEISLTSNDSGETATGSMLLDGLPETFHANLISYSPDQYRAQWLSALKRALHSRRFSAIFYNIDLNKENWGLLWLYELIPSELTDRTEGNASHIYVTERFMPVTTDPDNFKKRIFMESEDGTNSDYEISFYFLDLSAPERFFGYLDDTIDGVSHWKFSNEEIELFLSGHDVSAP